MEGNSFFARIKDKLSFKKHKKTEDFSQEIQEEEKDNPYLPYIRKIMEEVLAQRDIGYGDFFPILVDGEKPEKTLFAAKELGLELNRMAILTDNSEYYEDYRDTMYEEQGLIIEILPKKKEYFNTLLAGSEKGITIIDFENKQELISSQFAGEKLYIPIFKKSWESSGNIDIAVPIGYNTLIVSGVDTTKKQPFHDKFEQAFYDRE